MKKQENNKLNVEETKLKQEEIKLFLDAVDNITDEDVQQAMVDKGLENPYKFILELDEKGVPITKNHKNELLIEKEKTVVAHFKRRKKTESIKKRDVKIASFHKHKYRNLDTPRPYFPCYQVVETITAKGYKAKFVRKLPSKKVFATNDKRALLNRELDKQMKTYIEDKIAD